MGSISTVYTILTLYTPILTLRMSLSAPYNIRSVEGLSGLRKALLSDAQELNQRLQTNYKTDNSAKSPTKSPKRVSQSPKKRIKAHNPYSIEQQSASTKSLNCWGYVIILDGHWATVFCFTDSKSENLTAILFDTLDVYADAENLYRTGIIGSDSHCLNHEIKRKICKAISFKFYLFTPLSEFRRVNPDLPGTSRVYLNRDLISYQRVVV